jgi:hypothetical protein
MMDPFRGRALGFENGTRPIHEFESVASPIDDSSLRSTARAANASGAGFDAPREEGRRKRCEASIDEAA